MEKAYKKDMVEEVEPTKHEELSTYLDHGLSGTKSFNNKSNQKSIMSTGNVKSPSMSESLSTRPPSTYKPYRPKLQKQESLPSRGNSSSVNTSQSMPFNQPKLSNGKVEYSNVDGMRILIT